MPTPAAHTPVPNQLDALIADHETPQWQTIARIIMAVLGAFLLWSMFARLEEVSIAPGEVVPQGRIKTIQHLEGGIIEEIYIREGDTVREGAPLVQLDLAGATQANLMELKVRLDGLLLTKARLEAEAEQTDLAFPPALAQRQSTLVAAEKAAYAARKSEFQRSLAVLEEQVRQREQDIREIKVRLKSAENNLALANERLTMSEDLLSQGLTSRMEHTGLQSQAETLQGDVAGLKESVPRAEAALTEAKARVSELDAKFRREARESLKETELNLARTQELLASATDQETRTTIKSPIDGVVKNMRYFTIGGVVRPGEPILDIVPSDDTLVTEARLNPMDRAFVRVGQKANVKVDAYDFARYGGLSGEVISVAPDTTVPENAPPYLKVMIKTDNAYLGEESEGLMIAPGMGATVDIHTGSKTVMQYLLKPVLKLKTEAFRER
ncbi:MAG: HlyD family type I secretion periplasmic adaptor subunit [Rhodobacteraceae bacterium]|nr:HlyD family type I secretion periplasmic adaptor subunit [Paracoccaceae bacterium]